MTNSAIITIVTVLSSSLITIVSNLYSLHIRKVELKVQTAQNQYSLLYAEKATAFKEFVSTSSSLIVNIDSGNNYELVLCSAHKALLLCNNQNKSLLNDFISFVDCRLFDNAKPDAAWRHLYWEKLSILTCSLNEELQSASHLLF